jgi:hypothetical protein
MHEGRGLTLRQARQLGTQQYATFFPSTHAPIVLFLLMHAITVFPVLMHVLCVNACKASSSAASKPAFLQGGNPGVLDEFINVHAS